MIPHSRVRYGQLDRFTSNNYNKEEKAGSTFEVREKMAFRGQCLVNIAPMWRSSGLFSPILQQTGRIFLENSESRHTAPSARDAALP